MFGKSMEEMLFPSALVVTVGGVALAVYTRAGRSSAGTKTSSHDTSLKRTMSAPVSVADQKAAIQRVRDRNFSSSSDGDGDMSAPHHRPSINRADRIEYRVPPGLAMSRKYSIDLTSSAVDPERQKLLGEFQWRRFRHPKGAMHKGTQGGAGKEWIVVPSLTPSELKRIDAAGRAAATARRSPPLTGIPGNGIPRVPSRGRLSEGVIRDDGLQVDKFAVQPEPDQPEGGRDVAMWKWRRLFLGDVWVCIPSMAKVEIEAIRTALFECVAPDLQLKEKEKGLVSDMTRLQALLRQGDDGAYTFAKGRGASAFSAANAAFAAAAGGQIEHVVMIVVVEAEIAPILEALGFDIDKEATANLMGLATVRTGVYKGSYRLSVLKVAESQIFSKHYSGYTQAAAVAALTCRLMAPDLILSFGTSGGVPGKAKVGEVVLADGCLFLDRIRSRDKNAFDWGVWGGGCVPAPRMAKALGLRVGTVASQVGYGVGKMHEEIIRSVGVSCLDMEAAPISQITNQAHVNMLALKVVSNGVYPDDPHRMEAEYHDNREQVSRRATEVIVQLLDFLVDRTLADL